MILIEKNKPFHYDNYERPGTLSCDKYVELNKDIDPPLFTGETDNYPQKYRKGLVIEERQQLFDLCTKIEMMDAEEMAQKDAEIVEEQRVNSYKGNRIRISGNSKKALDVMTGFMTLAMSRKFPIWVDTVLVSNPEGKIMSTTSTSFVGLDMIETTDYDNLSQINGILIETRDQDPIDTILADGSYKYLIPQVV